jgi:hypothetical protein
MTAKILEIQYLIFLKNFFLKTLDFCVAKVYNIVTVRKYLTNTQGKVQKGEKMDEEMNVGELLKQVTEENTIRKILAIVKESKDKEEAIKKIEALLK